MHCRSLRPTVKRWRTRTRSACYASQRDDALKASCHGIANAVRSRSVIRPACGALIVLFAIGAATAAAQRGDTTAAAAAIYRRYAAQVVRIEVVEQSSAAKSGVGSGFFVTAAGHIVTNYHVIASLVTDPDRYRAQITSSGRQPSPLHLVGIDVVHDL